MLPTFAPVDPLEAHARAHPIARAGLCTSDSIWSISFYSHGAFTNPSMVLSRPNSRPSRELPFQSFRRIWEVYKIKIRSKTTCDTSINLQLTLFLAGSSCITLLAKLAHEVERLSPFELSESVGVSNFIVIILAPYLSWKVQSHAQRFGPSTTLPHWSANGFW